jgi:spore coat protein U-like protein
MSRKIEVSCRQPIATVLAFSSLLCGIVCSPASAATATGQFGVSLTIQAECKVQTASSLAFGSAGVIDSAITSTSALGIQCTNGTTYSVGLDPGAGTGATTAVRRLTSSGATINYALYRDSNRTQLWGQTVGTDTYSGTGSGAVQSVTIYGAIPAQTTPASGSYSDTVQVTVTY